MVGMKGWEWGGGDGMVVMKWWDEVVVMGLG